VIKVAHKQSAKRVIDLRLRKIRPHLDCAVEARQRLVEAFQLVEGEAAIRERLGVVWLHLERIVETRQGLVEAPEFCRVRP
jgi:hypothetical protein